MVDFQEIEEKWQKKWEKKKLFENNPKKGEKYFVTVPYPYTSGPFHIGHGRTYSTADIFVRYQRMQGKNVLWPMGFHVTGTPVLSISKKIKKNDWKTLEMYKNYISLHTKDEKKVNEILTSFSEPENVMGYFSKTFENDFKAIGCSIDWRRTFTTTDEDYNKFIEWQFKNLKEEGYITKGEYPVLYCKNCRNAVGEDDIKGGDEIKAKVEELSLIKFKVGDKYLVAATFRPETIFGVTNIWINPRAKYVQIQMDKERWILSKNGAEKLKYQNRGFEIEKEFYGKELIGKKVEEPIDKRKIPVLEASFVDPDQASGVVYSVPAHAPFDYIALVNAGKKIDLISMIDVEGYGDFPAKEIVEKIGIKKQTEEEKLKEATDKIYKAEYYSGKLKKNCGKYAGKKIAKIKDLIVKDFKKKDIVDTFYEVAALEKPVKCRCKGEVIAAILEDQWFIDYGNKKWKEKGRECLEKMKIFPPNYKKQFKDTIEWLHERPCARRRGLGTQLPFNKDWIIESLSDSTIYMAFYTVVHHIRKEKIKPEQLVPEFWDYVLLKKGSADKLKEKTGINKTILDKLQKEFDYWYPVDLRHTSVNHITNHLTFYILNHAAIFPKKNWPQTISLNELMVLEGRKMSKSLGNVIPLVDIPKKYGADLFRLYMAFSADLPSVLDWREEDVSATKSKLLQFYGIVEEAIKKTKPKNNSMKEWFVSRFNKNLKAATEAMENYSPRDYVLSIFYNVLNDVSYFRRRGGDIGSLKEVMPDWIKALTPVIPHACEELWAQLGNKSFVSVEKWPKYNEKAIRPELEKNEKLVNSLTKDIYSIKKLIEEKPEKITVFVASAWKYKLVEIMMELRDKEKLEGAIKKAMKIPEIKKQGNRAVKLINKFTKDPSKIPEFLASADKEIEVYTESKDYLSSEFESKVEIIKEEDSKEAKAKQAMPGKPAILVK